MTGIAFATPTFLLSPAGDGSTAARPDRLEDEGTFGEVLDRAQEVSETEALVRPRSFQRVTNQRVTNQPGTEHRGAAHLTPGKGASVLMGPGRQAAQAATVEPVAAEIQAESGPAVADIGTGTGPEALPWPVALLTTPGPTPVALAVQAEAVEGAPAIPAEILLTPEVEESDPGSGAEDLKKLVFASVRPDQQTAESAGGEEPGEPSETEAGEAEPLRDPTAVAAPVEILLPVPPPVARPMPETSRATGGGPTDKAGVTLSATPAAPETMPAPEAAVHLRIKAPPEQVPDPAEGTAIAQSAALRPTRVEQQQPVEQKPTESLRPEAVRNREVEVAPATTQPGEPLEAETNIRIQSASPDSQPMAHHGSERQGERPPDERKPSPVTRDTPAETLPERSQTESAVAPVFSARTPELPSHIPGRATPDVRPVPGELIPPQPMPKAPLKSISLEFSPEGSADVQLKLSERAGEVHVSLHSSDAKLNHQLRSGIGDLANALAGAGYEAEAWTSQERGGRQQREQYQPAERQERKAGAMFQATLNESPQEVL